MMVAAWLVTIALRRVAGRFGLLRYVWHPALFVFAVYMIVLSSTVLIVARRSAMTVAEFRSKRDKANDREAVGLQGRRQAAPSDVAS